MKLLNLMLISMMLAAPAFAQSHKFNCTYSGNSKKDQPYYGRSFKLVIQDKSATIYDKNGKQLDYGNLSDSWKKYPNPRFFGFDDMADCASGDYMEVDKAMLDGEGGSIELTGPGNEDCGVEDSNYNCKTDS